MQNKLLILTLALFAFSQSGAHSQGGTAIQTDSLGSQSAESAQNGAQNQQASPPTQLGSHAKRFGRAKKILKRPDLLPAITQDSNFAQKPPLGAVELKSSTQAGISRERGRDSASFSTSGEAPGDMNMFQIKPTILNERYMRSGRADRTLRLPGILPPEAPIPDNMDPINPKKK